MKLFFFLVIFFSLGSFTFSQTGAQSTHTMLHDGEMREYILYVPQTYDGQTKVPLILNFHGYSSDMSQQLFFGDFRKIADTANFIMVLPNGMKDSSGMRNWNVSPIGGYDDVGFVSELIDNLTSEYAIDEDRVYSTGMSNGGFITFYLGCTISDKITAIASVTGTMLNNSFQSCVPSHPMPTMIIHGTNDPLVDYNGNTFFKPIPEVIEFWVNQTQSNPTPIVTQVPNTSVLDGSTVEHYLYSGGTNGATVEHFKVINGGHTWPGSVIPLPGTNMDINASVEIWRFFSKYKTSRLLKLNNEELSEAMFLVYPNPSSGSFYIAPNQKIDKLEIVNAEGRTLHTFLNVFEQIEIGDLPAGIYYIQSHIKGGFATKKVVVY